MKENAEDLSSEAKKKRKKLRVTDERTVTSTVTSTGDSSARNMRFSINHTQSPEKSSFFFPEAAFDLIPEPL